MRKKKIFIGSSSEALPILEKVEKLLEDEYDIVKWEKSFTYNNSTLDCLIENAIKVDEAIFIGTGDDIVNDVKGERGEKIKSRDNVVFEFGLFLGMLGRKDCVYLVDKNIDTMSDYSGITVVMFEKDNDQSIQKAVGEIKTHFAEYSKRDINLFPSVSLASNYFYNFISQIFDHYLNNDYKIITENKSYDECEITVVIPEKITDDINKQIDELKHKFKTHEETIKCIGHGRTILVNDKLSTEKKLEIIDFPTVISSIRHAVYALLPYEDMKKRPDYESIFYRELQRFAEALEFYIKEAPCKSINVIIKNENNI